MPQVSLFMDSRTGGGAICTFAWDGAGHRATGPLQRLTADELRESGDPTRNNDAGELARRGERQVADPAWFEHPGQGGRPGAVPSLAPPPRPRIMAPRYGPAGGGSPRR
jgi:hypothetical protein